MMHLLLISDQDTFLKEAAAHIKPMLPAHCAVKTSRWSDVRPSDSGTPLLVLADLREMNVPTMSVKNVAEHFINTKIVGVGHPADVAGLLEYLKIGIKDFLAFPVPDGELQNFIQKSLADASSHGGGKRNGRVIAFYAPKGGCGVTFVAANTAVAMAKYQKSSIALCDFSKDCGDAATYLNLQPKYTLRDALDNSQLLDASFLEGVLTPHSSGLRVLAAAHSNQEPPSIDSIHALKSIFSLLTSSYDYLFVDAGHMDAGLLQFVLSESDFIILLGNPDVPSIKGLVNLVQKLTNHQFDPQKIKVIINRDNSKNQIDSKEFEKITRHSVTTYIPNNYALCIESVNKGEPVFNVNDKGDVSKKILELAQLIHNSFAAANDKVSANTAAPSMFQLAKKGILKCF